LCKRVFLSELENNFPESKGSHHLFGTTSCSGWKSNKTSFTLEIFRKKECFQRLFLCQVFFLTRIMEISLHHLRHDILVPSSVTRHAVCLWKNCIVHWAENSRRFIQTDRTLQLKVDSYSQIAIG